MPRWFSLFDKRAENLQFKWHENLWVSSFQFKQYGLQRHKNHFVLHWNQWEFDITLSLEGVQLTYIYITPSVNSNNKDKAKNWIWISGPRLDIYSTRVTFTWNQLIFGFFPHHNKMWLLHLYRLPMPRLIWQIVGFTRHIPDDGAAFDFIIHISIFKNSMLTWPQSNENSSKLFHL